MQFFVLLRFPDGFPRIKFQHKVRFQLSFLKASKRNITSNENSRMWEKGDLIRNQLDESSIKIHLLGKSMNFKHIFKARLVFSINLNN